MEKLETKKSIKPQFAVIDVWPTCKKKGELINRWEAWKKEYAEWEKEKTTTRSEINKFNKANPKYEVLSEEFRKKCCVKELYFMNKANEIYLERKEVEKQEKEADREIVDKMKKIHFELKTKEQTK